MTADHAHARLQTDFSRTAPSPVDEFVTLAHGLFDLPDSRWEDSSWDATSWCASRSKAVRWRFVSDRGVPFNAAFGDVVKAALVYQARVNNSSPRSLVNWLVPIRTLYEVVCGGSELSPSFSWAGLVLRDWQRAEERVTERLSPGTRYMAAGTLQSFAGLLESRGIISQTRYKHRQRRPRDLGVRHIEDRDAALQKLPPEGALHALADAAQDPKDEWDRFLFAIVKLLVALGFRVGEVLSLPVDCWRTDEEGRPYLVYWPEKGGPLSPRWVPSPAVELVRGALETLWALTEKARGRARVLEDDPTRVPLLGDYRPDELLGVAELSAALQMEGSGVRKHLAGLDVRPSTKCGGANGKGWLWKVHDVERALAKALPEHRYELSLPTGGKQRLSEFLCLMPKTPRNGSPSLLTVRPVPASAMENFISAHEGRHRKTVFERYGLLDANGEPWSVRTHQFRHWINTIAHKGGLSDMELARWMGRKDSRQNRQYQHLDTAERIERAKEAVRVGEVGGSVAEVYERLPVEERERFLDGHVEAANVTPYGMCTHSFATKPCPYHVQCLTGCGSFMRTKGSQREIIAIEQVKRRAKKNVQEAEKAAREGQPEAASWVDAQRRLLDGAERALAVEDTPCSGAKEGENVRVFPDTPSLADGNPKRPGGLG